MKTGLVNMGLGILIAAIGALVTAVTYSMVSSGGGTYVVATGAFVVGAWRFLLGLFQVLRSAVGGSDAGRLASSPASLSSGTHTPTRVHNPDASNASPIIGGILIGEAVLRAIFVCIMLSRVPSAAFSDASFLFTSVILPVALAAGAFAAGVLILRKGSGAIKFGTVICTVGLLFQAFIFMRLLSLSLARLPWVTWTLFAVHVVVYVVGLIVLIRSSSAQKFLGEPLGDQR